MKNRKLLKTGFLSTLLLLILPNAQATTGLNSLAGLGEAIIHLAYLVGYLFVFLLLLIFVKNRKLKVTLIPAFFAGLLFVPPFQYIDLVSFHYIKPVSNIPAGKTTETVQLVGDNFLKRNNGELIYFPTRFGGNHNYWRTIKNDTPIVLEKDSEGVVSIVIYDKKQASELSQVQSAKFGRNKIIVPIFAFEYPEYRELRLSGRTLKENWEASGDMLFGASGKNSDPSWVQNLIDRGADVNYQDPLYLNTSLHRAIDRSQFETAKVLIQAGARSDIANTKGISPIGQLMVQINDPLNRPEVSKNKELLKLFADDWQATGEMLIAACTSTSDPSWVKYLIKRGAPINYQEAKHQNTALHLVLMQRQYETAKILIRAGARARTVNKVGKKPGDTIKEIFESPKADDDLYKLKRLLELVDKRWRATGKMLHIRKDEPKWIQILIDHGADFEMKNSNDNTALHHAIQIKNYENAKVLVSAGADLSIPNGPGMTAVESLSLFIDENESSSDRRKRKELLELIEYNL